MIGEELYVVQYLRAGTVDGVQRLPAERPRIYRVAAFSGDTVWGINVDTQVLTRVNRTAADGSGRVMNMQALTNLSVARRVAERIAAEMDAAEAEVEAAAAAAAAAKEAARRVKYPTAVSLEALRLIDGEDGEGDGEDGADGDVQVGVSFTVKPAKPADAAEPAEPQDLTDD